MLAITVLPITKSIPFSHRYLLSTITFPLEEWGGATEMCEVSAHRGERCGGSVFGCV